MKINNSLLNGYENTVLIDYDKVAKDGNVIRYEDLPETEVSGVLKANYLVDGKLQQLYSERENHVGVIAATRLGKTTQYVIPTIYSYSHFKNKRSMIISDPKGELYKLTSKELKKQGYDVKLLNFRDYLHSEFWNPLGDIYDHYQAYANLTQEVKWINTEKGPRNEFLGKIYENQAELDEAIRQYGAVMLEQVYSEIHRVCIMMITTESQKDPHWEDTARLVLEALIIGLLEDSVECETREKVTKDNFSIASCLGIMENMYERNDDFTDNGFFTSRKETSKAFLLAKSCLLDTARATRTSILNVFNTKMAIYKTSAIRLLTSTTSLHMSDLVGEKPVAVFIVYRDEIKEHYSVISTFIQQAYGYLIEYANESKTGKLDNPFYFVLDEFGNFPPIKDFEVVISAAGGRNIFFVLVLQSYAQLNNVYGNDIAVIIRDNLNVHVFIGSNNPSTLEEFSKECGEYTRISPISAITGEKENIDRFQLETIRLMPKSRLSSLKEGECIVTEANCGYVMLSKLERYYKCDELNEPELANEKDYVSGVNPLDRKYHYFTNRD
ncbi:MAG: type IV secretory system conjugative DNA transfer family protein [Clostridia bacterium]|nr:type IV secretory system conjugative DNA transfer family protein [Clostridia bacterium]